jgi:hypothetical protein
MNPQQYNLFTQAPEPPADVVERIRHLLRQQPWLRDSYAMLIGAYWLEFEGLDRFIPPERQDEFLRWIDMVTKPKTIQNRALEIQKSEPDLAPSPKARRIRDWMSKQGIVR